MLVVGDLGRAIGEHAREACDQAREAFDQVTRAGLCAEDGCDHLGNVGDDAGETGDRAGDVSGFVGKGHRCAGAPLHGARTRRPRERSSAWSLRAAS
ncbi:Hypothetical protein A7982_09516 [Minicystis rosea]|nr:Hypothetical protein A7982_09516 [Minicystis rosea]